MEQTKTYRIGFDLINIFSCIAVVAMHVNGTYWNYAPDARWVFSCTVGSFCSFAVPVFMMLSGANLIDYPARYSTKEYFKKRFFKTVVPFLIWSAISVLFACLRDGVSAVFRGNPVTEAVNILLNTRTTEYYWFFLPLFTVYLSIPFFAAIREEKRQKVFGYAIFCGILLNAVLPYLSGVCGIAYNPDLNFPISSSYLIYALIGYYVAHYPLKRSTRWVIYALGVTSLLLNLLGTVFASFRSGELTSVLDGNLQFARIFWSLAVFTLFRYVRWDFLKKPKILSVVRTLSSLSFGVYLSHYFVLQILYRLFPIRVDSRRWIVLGTAAVYLICLGITYVLKKIPVLKKIVP